MKFPTLFVIAAVSFSANAHAQSSAAQPTGQAGAQASAQTSVNNRQAQASGSTSANSSASAQARQGGAYLAGGTAFNGELAAPIDSKKAKPGDPVSARTTEPVKQNGKTVIPKGAKLVGHVTQALSRAKGDADSALAIQFDKVVLKNGEEIPLNLTIQALAPASSGASVGAEDMRPMGGTGGSAAASGTTSTSGRGALGGVTSTAGGAANSITETTSRVDSTAAGSVNATERPTAGAGGAVNGAASGLNSAGQLSSHSRGVFGLNGLSLNAAGTNATQGSVITSTGKNVHLDSGTRMLLVCQAATSSSAKP